MKKIEAIVRPFKLEDLKEALEDIGVRGMTVTEVKGWGRQKGHKEIYRGAEYEVELVPMVKLEIVVPDLEEDRVLDALMRTAKTGHIGDGKLFVTTMDETIRIRTGERGEQAL
jgi:nitrogen regulatory protein PII